MSHVEIFFIFRTSAKNRVLSRGLRRGLKIATGLLPFLDCPSGRVLLGDSLSSRAPLASYTLVNYVMQHHMTCCQLSAEHTELKRETLDKELNNVLSGTFAASTGLVANKNGQPW